MGRRRSLPYDLLFRIEDEVAYLLVLLLVDERADAPPVDGAPEADPHERAVRAVDADELLAVDLLAGAALEDERLAVGAGDHALVDGYRDLAAAPPSPGGDDELPLVIVHDGLAVALHGAVVLVRP